MSVYYRDTSIENISLDMVELKKNTNINTFLVEKLKAKLEGKCNVRGLIQKGSLEILTRSSGIMHPTHFKGDFHFQVRIAYNVCNPKEGSILRCYIYNINKAGLLGGITTDMNSSPLMILIPRHHHVDIDQFHSIKIGDTVEVEVIGKKFELVDTQIRIIAILKESNDDYQTGGENGIGDEIDQDSSVIDIQHKEQLHFVINHTMTNDIDLDTIPDDNIKNMILDLRSKFSANEWKYLENDTKNALINSLKKKLDDDAVEDKQSNIEL